MSNHAVRAKLAAHVHASFSGSPHYTQLAAENPPRDAEPGKILHEIRYGELSYFKRIPHTPYYGTADATPLYLITLHAAWQATGDHALLEQHLETAEGCLRWIDKYGDRDGDGSKSTRQIRQPAMRTGLEGFQ